MKEHFHVCLYNRLVRICFFFLVCFSLLSKLTGQHNDSLLQVKQDEIIISGLKYSQNFTWSLVRDSVNMSDIFSQNIDILLNRLPGLNSYNSENPAQDVRISVRGFGARSAFGIRGIKVYLDGIPMTSPDGTTQLDEISLFSLHQTELIRSNFSSRLGNAGGGALSCKTEPYFTGLGTRLRANNSGGYDAGITWGHKNNSVSNLLTVNHHVLEGQREHARGQNTVLYNKTRWSVSDHWILESFLNIYHSPDGEDPGSVTRAAFESNALAANRNNIAFNAGEAVSGVNAAVKSSWHKGKNHTLYNTLFYKQRDFTGRLPFRNGGIVDVNRHFYGLHTTYEYAKSSDQSLTFGTGFEWQSDDRERFENNEGVRGNADLNQNESVRDVFLFQQWQKEFTSWGVHQMSRFDYFRFSVNDFFTSDGVQNGQKQFSNLQAAAGLFYNPFTPWKSYVNLGTGFETPTLNEYSNNPENTGGFNQTLSPERSLQAEWGNNLDILHNLHFSSSFYWIDVQNLISGFEIEEFPGRTFYRNSSRARRTGLETMINWEISPSFSLSSQYVWSRHTFTRHTLNGVNYAGNVLPLSPAHRWTLQWMHNIHDILQYSLWWSYQSSFFADDANAVRIDPQPYLQCTVSTGTRVFKNVQAGFALYNLFNLTKFSNIRANAAGGRYYEAASPTGGALFVQYRFQK